MEHHTFNKETKTCSASWPRTPQSTLCATDRLELVYDVYTNADQGHHPCASSLNLVFLHGSGMSRVVWEYYLPRLTHADPEGNYAIHKIVLIDQATHGDSGVLNRGKLGTNFNWIDGGRDALKIAAQELGGYDKRPAINVVIGHSMGGFQALVCDVLQPSLFHLLILIEPVVVTRQPSTVVPPDFPQIPENLYNSLRLKTRDSFGSESEYVRYMKNDSFFTNAHDQILQRIIDFERIQAPSLGGDGSVRTKMDQAQNLLCYMNMQSFAPFLISNVKFVDKRAIHIVGARSNWCPPENQLFLQKTLQNYHLDVISGGSHLVNIEAPDLVIEKINHHIHEFVLTSQLQSSYAPHLSLDERMVKFNQAFESFKSRVLVKSTKPKL
ncbi:YOR084W [Saccharomyces arboricola H-6]|uniref:YOR084W n=1 Tax=Saccharomyces arboricola (strain H-6 / AS 2.3317 / CBS 10644) TaxID=1160507 RepID=J8PZ46_SACAR|nr:YOR084W [Saccharomyces arboricola H-6]